MLLQMPVFTLSSEVLAFGQSLLEDNKKKNADADVDIVSQVEVKLSALCDTMDDDVSCYQPLLYFLEHTSSITSVILDGNYMEGMEAPQSTVSLFLHAISKNHNTTQLAIRLCKTSVQQFQQLLLNGNIQDLQIKWCFWGRDDNDNVNETTTTSTSSSSSTDTDIVASAFRNNTTLQRLTLDRVGHKYVTSIVAALATHPKLTYLSVHAEGAIAPTATWSQTIQQSLYELTCTSQTLQQLELNAFRLQLDVFAPIAKGLLKSTSVTCLSFHSCSFFRSSTGSIGQLLRVIRSNNNNNNNHNTGTAAGTDGLSEATFESVGSLMANLIQTNKTLTVLDMTQNNHIFCKDDFALVLQAIANSTTLQSFHLGSVHDPNICQLILTTLLPHMVSVSHLHLELGLKTKSLLPQILSAFRSNTSLTRIDLQADDDFLQPHHYTQIQNYALRNQTIPKLLCASSYSNLHQTSVTASCLPRVLHKALDAASAAAAQQTQQNTTTTTTTTTACTSTIFQGLLRLSGQDILPTAPTPKTITRLPTTTTKHCSLDGIRVPCLKDPRPTTYVSCVA